MHKEKPSVCPSCDSGFYPDAYTASVPFDDGHAWSYGKEVWCNLEGRFMHIIAENDHIHDQATPHEISLC